MNIFEYIFPKQCLICSKIGENVCSNCIKELSYTLPSCFICKKLSNRYWTHKNCLDFDIQCFTGWYLSKNFEYELKKKIEMGIYSTHISLLNILIYHLHLEDIIENSQIYPIQSKNRDINNLNINLAKSINTSVKEKEDILFIGYTIENSNNLLKNIKGLYTEPSHLRILILFDSTIPELQ